MTTHQRHDDHKMMRAIPSMATVTDSAHDKLDLADNLGNAQLRRNEEVIFSNTLTKVNRHNIKRERCVMVTSSAVYVMRPRHLDECRRKVDIKLVTEIWVAVDDTSIVIRVPSQYDLYFICPSLSTRQNLVDSIRSCLNGRAGLKIRQVTTLTIGEESDISAKARKQKLKMQCAGCAQMCSTVNQAYVTTYSGRLMHARCFNCMICDKSIDHGDKYFAGKSGLPLCSDHAHHNLFVKMWKRRSNHVKNKEFLSNTLDLAACPVAVPENARLSDASGFSSQFSNNSSYSSIPTGSPKYQGISPKIQEIPFDQV